MSVMLASLLPELAEIEQAKLIALSGLTDDTRLVKQGDLFLAVSGANHRAEDLANEAAYKFAAAILSEESITKKSVHGVPVFPISDLAARRSEIAGTFYSHPSKDLFVVAVTGTNGKTSCSHFIADAMSELGQACGIVGTVGSGHGQDLSRAGLTTPGAVLLQEILSEFRDAKLTAVSIEASSHGLSQGRLNGIQVDIAIFTNLTRDHLDYHGTVENYFSAKEKLFVMDSLSAVVINIDDEFGNRLIDAIAPEVKVLTYGLNNAGADIFAKKVDYHTRGFEAQIVSPWGELDISASIFGEFNLSNILAVIAVLGQRGFLVRDISNAISHLANVRGRMHRVKKTGSITVLIDYAHTPDALEKALKSVRLHNTDSIWCVMGCGGDRDQGKRAPMGRISTELAEHTIVTSDNPRMEDPQKIVNDILKGCINDADVTVEIDRKRAIEYALSHAQEGEVILIAGKGHEEYQEREGERFFFSDFDVVERYLGAKSECGEA